MSSFARRIKRRQHKILMKDFRKSMRNFKKMVKCTKCDYQPKQGENIDDWHIDKNSENIDLICTNCLQSEDVGSPDAEV